MKKKNRSIGNVIILETIGQICKNRCSVEFGKKKCLEAILN